MTTYGPLVECPTTGDAENTHRPGASGPFFCMACGSTSHEPAKR